MENILETLGNILQPQNTDIFTLSHNGNVIFKGTQDSCYMKLQKIQSNSATHAMRYEGYKINPFECTDSEATEILKDDPFADIQCELLEDKRGFFNEVLKVKVCSTGELKRANTKAMRYTSLTKGSIVYVSQSYIY